MAQNDTRNLVLDLVQELEGLKTSEELLNIALQQLNREDPKTIARLVLLAELAASHLNCSIENIGFDVRKLRNTPAFKQSDKL